MDPLKTYYVFVTSACARRPGAPSQAFERMHSTLSHRMKTKAHRGRYLHYTSTRTCKCWLLRCTVARAGACVQETTSCSAARRRVHATAASICANIQYYKHEMGLRRDCCWCTALQLIEKSESQGTRHCHQCTDITKRSARNEANK